MTINRWVANAASITDVWTIALSGTVTSQTYSMTINGKSVTYTSTGGDTVATILAALVAAWNLTTNPPEFNELTAAGVGTVGSFTGMTITQDVSGRPSVITVATGGGATFTITNTTVASGPNFFDNALNWTAGAPANSQTLVFDNGSVPCKYNISTSLTGIVLNVNAGYSGQIGLPLINADGQVTYNEYRTTSLTLAGGTAVINSTGINRCNLAFGANTTTIRVLSTGARLDTNTPVVLVIGGNGSSELDISKGDVGIAFYQGQAATFPVIKTGYIANPLQDVSLIVGSGATLTTVTKNGGNARISSNVTTVTQDVLGGTLTIADAATVTTLNAYGGTVAISSTGTIGTINAYGQAIIDADQDPRARTITNPINVYSTGVTVKDNQKAINSGTLSLATSGLASVNVQHGGNSGMTFV